MSRSVLLLRHGETEWNAAARLQGRGDSPLTEKGEASAARLAEYCAARGVRRVLASPLGRAQRTAACIAERCGCEVETEPALVEVDFGGCSGLTLREIADRFPGLSVRREKDRWNSRWPDGESYADAEARMTRWWRGGEPRFDAPPPAIVAHGALLRALRRVLTGESSEQVLARMLSGAMLWEVFESGGCHELEAGPVSRIEPARDARH